MINVDISGTEQFETIAEKLHEQKNWKIGIVSSVNLNHATPAAFYAHQTSRNNYYEIGQELVDPHFTTLTAELNRQRRTLQNFVLTMPKLRKLQQSRFHSRRSLKQRKNVCKR